MSPTEEWMREHKGPLLDVVGEVWHCGDEVCGCSQAQVVERYRNLADSRFIVPAGARDELIAYRDSLTYAEATRIRWEI